MSRRLTPEEIDSAVRVGFTPQVIYPEWNEGMVLQSYTVVFNSPPMGEGIPFVSHIECSIKATNIGMVLMMLKTIEQGYGMVITSIIKDR